LFGLIQETGSEQCQMIGDKSALSHPGPMMFKTSLLELMFSVACFSISFDQLKTEIEITFTDVQWPSLRTFQMKFYKCLEQWKHRLT